jgi:hypothetical protein
MGNKKKKGVKPPPLQEVMSGERTQIINNKNK